MGQTMELIEEFMSSPLVTWVRTFESDGGKGLTYPALADGVFLCDVMLHIWPGGASMDNSSLNRCPEDSQARLRNLSILMSTISAFYKDFLNQILVSSYPDVVKLSRYPESPEGVEGLRSLLLLVLGCSVQSHQKEDIIATIKTLDLATQHEIVRCIKEVTDNAGFAWPCEWNEWGGVPEEDRERAFNLAVGHCARLVAQRDKSVEVYQKVLLGESEASPCEDNVHHIGVQLAESKAQLRKLRQELDEKVETYTEAKEELDELKQTVSRLRQENLELVQDARSSRAFMDEADILRERAGRADALESEVSRYRDKMADIDFYKSRVEELREDNRILVETKEMLEDQLTNARRRAEQVVDLENKILQLKQQINQLNMDRDEDRERLRSLTEENAQLALVNRNSFSESAKLASQMESLRRSSTGPGNNVDLDFMGDAKTRVLKLELENQRLEGELSKLRSESQLEYQEGLMELEKENKRLSLKVNQLQEKGQLEKTQLLETQQLLHDKEKEAIKLQDVIGTVKMNSERQTSELQIENSHLQELIETLRERRKASANDQLTDIENQNKTLLDANMQLQSQVNRLQHEKNQLNKLTERLRESAERLVEVELQKNEIERENKELQMAISALRESCEKHDKIEENFSSLEVEFARVSKLLENTKVSLAKMEAVQTEKEQLQAEVEKLKRSLESLKLSSDRLADLETERDHLAAQTVQLTKQLENLKIDCGKVDQLEIELMSATNEVHKVKRAFEGIQKKLADTEKEKGEIEAENTKLQRTVEMLKVSAKKLNELEVDLTDLEGTNDRLDRENKSFKKEVDRLRCSLDAKDKLVEESSLKLSRFERENKRLTKEWHQIKFNEESVRIVEQDKRELERQILSERKTLSALREDLVAEKVKSQQLSNELESLQSDLTKLGLDPRNVCSPATEAEEDRFKALEAMLEETMKRSLELRDDKICSLEKRLADSTLRNQQLKHQLFEIRSDYESLVQRTQEQSGPLSGDSAKEMGKLKEALRLSNEEKICLENDVSSLTSQNAGYREQVCLLQSEVTSLSNRNAALSQLNGVLQGDNAKLQVENTTFQSQSASLIAHNSSLEESVTQLTKSKDKLKRTHGEQGQKLTQLVDDHESLQRLHEQLNREFEALTNDHNSLKLTQKTLKAEMKILKDRENKVSSNEDDLIKLKENLEKEMEALRNDSNSLASMKAEHSRLKDDFRCLFTGQERLRGEYKALQGDYKAAKSESNALKLKMIEMDGELNEAKDQMASLDVEATKLTNKCQMLEGINQTLEEDRRSLMSQVSLLLTQYHDLLTQTLEDKQHFHQEEKNFSDKLNNLRRQKEKLEEKIMEQYRRMDNSQHKKRGFGSTLVKRVRKAGNDLINKVPRSGRSRSRTRDEGDSPDSSSVGSSPTIDSVDSGSDTRRSSPHYAAYHPPSDGGLHPQPPLDGLLPQPAPSAYAPPTSASEAQHRKSNGHRPDNQVVLAVGSSLSSDDLAAAFEGSSVEGVGEDFASLASVGSSNGAAELTRAGSRRGLYLAREGARDRPSRNDTDAVKAARRISISSNSSLSNLARNVNGVHSSSVSLGPKCSTLVLECNASSTPLPPPPPSTSTPKPPLLSAGAMPRCDLDESYAARTPSATSFARACHDPSGFESDHFGSGIGDSNPDPEHLTATTPQLPPRMRGNLSSAPELPPRMSRCRVATISSVATTVAVPDPASSSHSTPLNGTPELRPKNKLNPKPAPPEVPPKPDLTLKENVDNSIWYEYGCV